eukprot:4690959-Pyramimonas_sp.AAC.1
MQMWEYADMLGPVGLDHPVALESTRAQCGLPCPHRPALRDGEVWRGRQGPSQTHDVPSGTPA